MNREIKFRLWNPERKVTTAGLDLNTLLMTTDADFVKSFHESKMIWMQFTGLKDKNGKEIYEGNILATSNNDSKYDMWGKDDWGTTQVVWNDDGFWDYTNWKMTLDDEDSVFCQKFTEIIGNIHETPELLKL